MSNKPYEKSSRYSVLICAGGTGGHLFPAQALAQQLTKKFNDIDILFAGGGLSTNPYFDRNLFSFRDVACGTFPLRKPLSCLKSCGKIVKGLFQSRKVFREFRPDLVVGFGSYYCLPPLLAARMGKIPIVLHAADSVPGKVIRYLSPYAAVTGIHFPEAAKYLKGKSLEVGMPLREGFRRSSIGREAGREYFGLDRHRMTILIFGGSQGAQSLNKKAMDAIIENFSDKKDTIQIIHYVGNSKNREEVHNRYSDNGFKACVKEFEKRMDLAWNVADLAISRSGASSIAEQIEFEVPGILIPYPHAADNHQEKNAEYMTGKVGGALKFSEIELSSKKLAEAIRRLIDNDEALLKGMRRAIYLHKNRPAQKDFCSVIYEMLERR